MNCIQRSLDKLVGEICWGISFSPLLNLSMSFGKPRLRIEEVQPVLFAEDYLLPSDRRPVSVRGRWWFWVCMSYWSVLKNGKTVASTSSSLMSKRFTLRQLHGQKLSAATVNSETGATRLVFDLGSVLKIRRFEANDDEMWMLFKPGGYVLCVCGDGSYVHEPGSGIDKRPGISGASIPGNIVVTDPLFNVSNTPRLSDD